ncbi:MAG TPA: zinc ribbon domain-containing protein [Candidatus Limnocylindria bacterium]|nr:zinc ribbon domain-containing protein [Candidatus Limnocylindria bacterium]
MEFIREAIEWVSSEPLTWLAGIFPYLLIGLVGLYLLWLLIGYLRVSQVGLREMYGVQQAVALPRREEDALPEAPRGLPYCPHDGLQYPLGARFCTACERDLVLDCATCGATQLASATSCYRCGTPTGVTGGLLTA